MSAKFDRQVRLAKDEIDFLPKAPKIKRKSTIKFDPDDAHGPKLSDLARLLKIISEKSKTYNFFTVCLCK